MRVLGVSVLWLLVAVIWASQSVFASSLQGNPMPFSGAIRTSLMQTLPWIPVTLAVIWLAERFPLTRSTLRTALPIHLIAFAALACIENLLVVLEFAALQRSFPGVGAVVRSALQWTLVRLHFAALVYVAIAATTQVIAHFRSSRAKTLQLARLEGQLARARLDALTAQIRPHFLFNTLHTIGQLWRSGRADEADAMLDHLGNLFGRVQQTTSRSLISLDEELETVEAYLAIEAVRFRDRLSIQIDVSRDARACAVPPLFLQPLAENAVRHGIAAVSTPGSIRVSGRVVGDRLTIDVEDSGPGVSSSAPSRGSGTGLANTRERLLQLFGTEHGMKIGSMNGAGTRVSITIPAQRVDRIEAAYG